MAVAFDAVGPSSSGTNSTTTPLTWTHVCAGTATDLFVGITTGNGSTNNVTSVKYNSVAMTQVGTYVNSGSAGAGGIAMYHLAAPSTGSHSVSVVFTGTDTMIGGSISFTGGNNGLGTAVTALGSNVSSITASVSSTTTGGMVVLVVCYGGDNAAGGGNHWSGTNSVTVQYGDEVDSSTAADCSAGGTVASTGGGASQTVGMSNSLGVDNWGIIAVEVLPASSTSVSDTETSGAESDAGEKITASLSDTEVSNAANVQAATVSLSDTDVSVATADAGETIARMDFALGLKQPTRLWRAVFRQREILPVVPVFGGFMGGVLISDTDAWHGEDAGFTFLSDIDASQAGADGGEQANALLASSLTAETSQETDAGESLSGTFVAASADTCQGTEAAHQSGGFSDSDTSGPEADGGESVFFTQPSSADTSHATDAGEGVDVYAYQPPFRWTGGYFSLRERGGK